MPIINSDKLEFDKKCLDNIINLVTIGNPDTLAIARELMTHFSIVLEGFDDYIDEYRCVHTTISSHQLYQH